MSDLTRRRVQHEIVAQHSDCCEESLILQVPGEGDENQLEDLRINILSHQHGHHLLFISLFHMLKMRVFFNGTAGIRWDYVALGFRGGGGRKKDIEERERLREAIDCVIKVVEKEVISRWW